MRIVHIVTAWPRSPDDVITPWLVALTTHQRAAGHDVHVLAPAYRGSKPEAGADVPVHRFRYAPATVERLTHEEATPDRLGRSPAYAALVPGYVACGAAAAARLGRRLQPDVFHVHWAVPHGVLGWAGARASGARLVTTFYGAEIRWAESRFRPALAFLRWYTRRSALVAISRSTAVSLANYTTRPITVVPYGVPFATGAEPQGARESAKPGLLFVGRLVPRKGVDRLLAALSSLSDRPWTLEIVGFGPERDKLERLAGELGLADRVRFLGRLSEAELVDAYRRASLFVLPATVDERDDTEGLGVVLLEAMSYGLPVVATRLGGITDIVEDGVTGRLVDDRVDALTAGIGALLDAPGRAVEMGAAGRVRVETDFGWPSIVARLDSVYAGGARR